QEADKTILDLLDRFLRLLEIVAELAEEGGRQTGRVLEGRENLPGAIREVGALRDHVGETWPWDERPVLLLDRKMAEESRAARARGESQDVAALLARLRADQSLGQE